MEVEAVAASPAVVAVKPVEEEIAVQETLEIKEQDDVLRRMDMNALENMRLADLRERAG